MAGKLKAKLSTDHRVLSRPVRVSQGEKGYSDQCSLPKMSVYRLLSGKGGHLYAKAPRFAILTRISITTIISVVDNWRWSRSRCMLVQIRSIIVQVSSRRSNFAATSFPFCSQQKKIGMQFSVFSKALL